MLSVVTPVLNGAKFIQENIDSISKLTIPHEHIIVDGGSTDDTLCILKKYPHLIVLNQVDKKGMYQAIDMGFKKAIGEYICWVNCDDRVIPDAYDCLYQYAEKNQYDFVSSDGIHDFVTEKRQLLIRSTRLLKYFISHGLFPFSQPSVLYKKKIYERVEGLRFELFRYSGDLDLFIRMSLIPELRFSYLPVITTIFLKHGQSLGDLGNRDRINYEHKQQIRQMTIFNRILLKIVRLLKI